MQGLTLSTVFLSCLLRAGSLLAIALSTMPLWKGFDPLLILAMGRRRENKEAIAEASGPPLDVDDEATAKRPEDRNENYDNKDTTIL